MKEQSIIVLLLMPVACFLFLSCVHNHEEEIKDDTPLLIIIGHDISATFKNYQPFDSVDMARLLNKAATTGRRVHVAFSPIGNPSDASFYRIGLQPAPHKDGKSTLRARIEHKARTEEVYLENMRRVSHFVDAFVKATEKSILQNHTDINGFVYKARLLVQEPQFAHYEKIVMLYTDGYADIDGNRQLSCSFEDIPSVELYLSGWKNKELCTASKVTQFESPRGFVDYLINRF